jgi:hypothetical protein
VVTILWDQDVNQWDLHKSGNACQNSIEWLDTYCCQRVGELMFEQIHAFDFGEKYILRENPFCSLF